MSKNKRLVIMLLAASVFIAVVVAITNDPPPPPPPPPSSNLFTQLKSKIDSMEIQAYEEEQYKGLKLLIATYGKSKQITSTDSLNLISLLELGKSKSLVISFDQQESTTCMGIVSLAKWTEELRRQEIIIPYPEAQKRIQRYKHMVQFLKIGEDIIEFKKTMYDDSKAQEYQLKISNMIAKPGVSGCPLANQKRSEWTAEIQLFKKKHNYFLEYQKKPEFFKYLKPCEELLGYPYYLNQLNCKL